MAVPARLSAKEGRKFAFTVGIAFLVLAGLSAWRGHVWPPRVMGVLGAALVLAGILIPGRLGPLNRGWMSLAGAISKVTAPIVVSAAYFIIITPIGWVMRLFGRNPMRHREQNGSLWLPVPSGGRSNLETQF